MKCYPDYYKNFNCIADKCKHNCCIGWEIDIDEDTLGFYKSHKGELKERFENSINYCDIPHFITDENERCPFLNDKNLCDIICTLGENHICDICTQHPRFHNELPGRTESGLGLCCEEACRLILTKKEKVTLVSDEKYQTDDEIILMRDKVIEILQNREVPLSKRVENMLRFCETNFEKSSLFDYANMLLSLEILDCAWENTLKEIQKYDCEPDLSRFDEYIKGREHEFEQFCVYLVYRHFANAPDLYYAQQRARFTAFAFDFLYKLGAFTLQNKYEYKTEMHLDFARMFSTEIEYSDENIYTLYDIL